MPTAHRLSFPTCLSHPRSIHLLCHLDSPSAANLPCLGLQQQTGPEILSSVAATGFLPGALSFLRALSHLERVAHRLGKTCLFNNNHLPHLERGYTQVIQPVSLISFPYKAEKQQGSTTNIQQQQTTPSQELCGRYSQLGQQTWVSQTDDRQTLQRNKAQQLRDTLGFPNQAIKDRLTALVSEMRKVYRDSTQRLPRFR
jgi:hypothetical protein